ncbi:porin [Aquincola sp. S2]|uniref:Porin n=1 Tax=Pseudaquabacterium terrae TaxID=2732868 RepID=A0ABX2EV74_9BURK|nr:porin [Aquabacterium terrae]NRF72367.1 porin [Aquabacterium terrae]
MKKHVIVAAVLATLAGTPLAQSEVTIYGRVDLGVAQYAEAAGSLKVRELRQGSGSRLGFRGVEDLGGGLSAFFDLQHRFDGDTGVAAPRYWEGQSIVGVGDKRWGSIYLGRTDAATYGLVEVPADPFLTETVAHATQIIRGRVGTNRNSSSINYRGTFGSVTLRAQIAEAEENPSTAAIIGVDAAGRFKTSAGITDKRPYSVAASYAAGPVWLAAGYENPTDKDDHWAAIAGSYDFGSVKLGAFVGSGKNVLAEGMRGTLLSLTAPIGSGALRASLGRLQNTTRHLTTDKQVGIGYQVLLSKRTALYTDIVRQQRDGIGNAKGAGRLQQTGFDLGIRHLF